MKVKIIGSLLLFQSKKLNYSREKLFNKIGFNENF